MKKEKVREFTFLLDLVRMNLASREYEHSLRVMQYVMCNPLIPEEIHDDCICAAIAHDLLEDSRVEARQLSVSCSPNVLNAIKLLTKPENMSYEAYIKEIKRNSLLPTGGTIAYWVKMADMKDHLAQSSTLTDALKEKYLNALPYLMP